MLEPVTAWTIVTEAPLKGLAFAREAGRILAWDLIFGHNFFQT